MTALAENFDSRLTQTSLLARALSRDADAWGELVDLYGPLIAHWCAKCGLDPHAAADCTQDVFSAVARKLVTFQPQRDEGSFRAWLWTITSNKIKDRRRAETRSVRGSGGSTALRSLGEIPDRDSPDLCSGSDDSRVASGVCVPEEEPTDELQISELVRRALLQIRQEFAEKTWRIFERSVVDDIATAQVAQEFEVTAATVRQSRSRILRRLREHLGDP